MKLSHYLLPASCGLDHREMSTVHAILDTGAVTNLVRSNVRPICSVKHSSLLLIFPFFDENCRPSQLLVMAVLRFRPGNPHLRVQFIVNKNPEA